MSTTPAQARQQVGELIRTRREDAGLTAAELGARLDPPMSVWKLCRIEGGKSPRVQNDDLFALGAALDIDPGDLMEPFASLHAPQAAAS